VRFRWPHRRSRTIPQPSAHSGSRSSSGDARGSSAIAAQMISNGFSVGRSIIRSLRAWETQRIRSSLRRSSDIRMRIVPIAGLMVLWALYFYIILRWLQPVELNIIQYDIITRSEIYVGWDVRVGVLGEKSATSSLRRTRGRERIILYYYYYYYYKAYNNNILKYCVWLCGHYIHHIKYAREDDWK